MPETHRFGPSCFHKGLLGVLVVDLDSYLPLTKDFAWYVFHPDENEAVPQILAHEDHARGKASGFAFSARVKKNAHGGAMPAVPLPRLRGVMKVRTWRRVPVRF